MYLKMRIDTDKPQGGYRHPVYNIIDNNIMYPQNNTLCSDDWTRRPYITTSKRNSREIAFSACT